MSPRTHVWGPVRSDSTHWMRNIRPLVTRLAMGHQREFLGKWQQNRPSSSKVKQLQPRHQRPDREIPFYTVRAIAKVSRRGGRQGDPRARSLSLQLRACRRPCPRPAPPLGLTVSVHAIPPRPPGPGPPERRSSPPPTRIPSTLINANGRHPNTPRLCVKVTRRKQVFEEERN